MAKTENGALTSITIKATVDTSSAKRSLEQLAEKIKKMKDAVGTGVKLPTANRIEKLGEAFRSWKGIRWTTITNGINNVADALGRISVLKIDKGILRQLEELRNGMISTKNTANAMSNAIKDAGVTPAVGGNIGHNIGGVLGGQGSYGHNVGGFLGGSTGHNIGGILGGQGSYGHNIGGTLGGGQGIGSVGHIAPSLGGAVDDMNAIVVVTNAYKASLAQLSVTAISTYAALKKLNSILTVLRTVMSPFKAIVKGAFGGLKTILSGIDKAAHNTAKSILSIGKKNTFKALKLVAETALYPFKNLGKSVKDLTLRFKGFFSSVKRIAVYRAIRFFLKELTQAFKEGIGNLYQYSLLINGTFAKSMDTLATSALYAKNSLAAMVAPLINELAPAVDYVVDRFVDLLNTINELFAVMTGADTWTKALKYPVSYAEAADDANSKAKDLRATLLGFDEINRLDDNRRGSRGSAEEQLDYSKMFEEQVTTSKMSKAVDKIKEAFASGDFSDIGRTIGEKLKKGLDKIPWGEIQSKVKKNAKSVGSLINGFVSADGLAESIGKTIAEAFNTVTMKIETFFSTVQWSNVGTFVGDSINTAVQRIDVIRLGSTLYTVFKSAVDFAKSLLGTIDWQAVGRKIGEFLNAIDFSQVLTDLGETLSELIGDAIDAAWELVKTSPVAGTVAIAFLGLKFGKILGSNMGAGVAASGLTGKISSLIPTVATIAVTALVGYKIGEKIFENFADGFKDELADTMETLDNLMADAFGIESEAYINMKNSWEAAKNAATSFFDLAETSEKQKQWLQQQGYDKETAARAVQLKSLLDIEDKNNEVLRSMGFQTDELQAQIRKQKILDDYTDEEIKAWQDLASETVKINFEATMDGFSDISQKVKDAFDKAKDGVKKVANDIGKTISGWISDKLGIGITATNNISGGKAGTTLKITTGVHALASGGEVQTGSLFIAGEAGAEIVSSAGGKTSVANRDQIADSVAIGNEEGNELLREQNYLLREILAKDTTVVSTITTGQITSALNRANVRSGNTVVAIG